MVHPAALVSPEARLAEDVVVEAYAVVGPRVELGPGVWVGSHAVVQGPARIGARTKVFPHAFVGGPPQDLKFRGEETWVEVGEETIVREFATIHRGTSATGTTVVGSHVLLMAYTHVAHDCRVGDHVILANGVQLGGHVEVGPWAIIGGMTPVHQFVRIGAHAMVGGGLRVTQDVAPFMLAADSPLRLVNINVVGLRRRGFSEETIGVLKKAHRLLCRSHLNTEQAMDAMREQLPQIPEIQELLSFLSATQRGFVK